MDVRILGRLTCSSVVGSLGAGVAQSLRDCHSSTALRDCHSSTALVMLPFGLRVVLTTRIAAGLSGTRRLTPLPPFPKMLAARNHLNESALTRTRRYNTVANIKSQIKRILTNKKSQDRNRAVKSEVKTAVRATREAISAGDKNVAAAALAVAAKKLDKAAAKGVIHQNQAANRKSAMAKQVASL